MTSQARTVLAAVRNTALAAIVVAGRAAIMASDVYAQRSVTQGRAETVIDDLYKCPVKVGNHRISAVGAITSSDGTVTDSSWKAQSFYIAPLMSPDDAIEKGNEHDTTTWCSRARPCADTGGACRT